MTKIEGLTFEPVTSLVGPVISISGEYWLYVPKGEKQIKIIKEGFATLEVNFSKYDLNIESSEVYVMELKSDNTPNATQNAKDPKGDIRIITIPSGATITIEDEPIYNGTIPKNISQHPVGVFKITIEKEYYNTVNTVFKVIPDSTSILSVKLVQNAGFLKFRVNPPSPTSNIYIDNRLIQGLDEKKLFSVSQGIHKLEITSKNWITYSREINVELGKTDSVFVDLKPELGKLIVNVSPTRTEKAEIWINDKKTEYLAPAQFQMQAGDMTLSLKLKGYPVQTKSFTLKRYENLNLDFKMLSYQELKSQLTLRRLKQNIWMATSIGAGAAAFYLITDSNKKNLAYQTAVGSDANTLHSQIEFKRRGFQGLLKRLS